MGEKLLKKLLSTKLLWCLTVLAVSTVMLAVGTITSDQWVTMAITLSGMAIGGNLGTKVVHAWGRNKEQK